MDGKIYLVSQKKWIALAKIHQWLKGLVFSSSYTMTLKDPDNGQEISTKLLLGDVRYCLESRSYDEDIRTSLNIARKLYIRNRTCIK